MKLDLILQALSAVSALATLNVQMAPVLRELHAAIESGEEAQVEAFLARIQPLNDHLGTA